MKVYFKEGESWKSVVVVVVMCLLLGFNYAPTVPDRMRAMFPQSLTIHLLPLFIYIASFLTLIFIS